MGKTLLQSAEKRPDRNPYKLLLAHKLSIIADNLTQTQYQLLFIINRRINICLSAALLSERDLDDALTLANLYNYCVDYCKSDNCLGRNGRVGAGDAQVCSNSFTTILLPQPRIDIKCILQACYAKPPPLPIVLSTDILTIYRQFQSIAVSTVAWHSSPVCWPPAKRIHQVQPILNRTHRALRY